MTSFLEFDRSDAVLVHDLVYSREGHQWILEKSSYRKLRLPIDWLEDAMVRVGFIVHRGKAGRLSSRRAETARPVSRTPGL